MSNFKACAVVALLASVHACGAMAQTPAPASARSATAVTTSDTGNTGAAGDVEKWTNKQWQAAKKEWARDETKWTGCRQQSAKQKLAGRKSWSFLYSCMTG